MTYAATALDHVEQLAPDKARMLAASAANIIRHRIALHPSLCSRIADSAGDRSFMDAAAALDHVEQLALDQARVLASDEFRAGDVCFDVVSIERWYATDFQPEQRLDTRVFQPVIVGNSIRLVSAVESGDALG